MSPSSRDQVRISVAPHQVALVRLARGMRARVADRKILVVENTTNSGWIAAMQTLREMLAHPNMGRADASVVLSNHFVRYVVLPWSAALVTSNEEMEFAHMRFVQVFGDTANGWTISLAPAPAGANRVAAAIDRKLIDTLGQVIGGSPLRLQSIQPALMSQFNAWRSEIGDDAWLVLAERGRALIGWIHQGQWRSLRARPITEQAVPLAQWIAQERLLVDAPASTAKVCLSVVDDVVVDVDGIRVQSLSPRARSGFAPRIDGSLLLAMAGAA